MKYLITLMIALFSLSSVYAEHEKISILHTKGQQAVGARFGKGTKNKFDVGLEYELCFNQRTALLCQIDMERATFGNSDFSNQFLFGGGVEIMCFHPATWMFIDIDLMGNVGYDKWTCEALDAEKSGIVGGANVGTTFEFYPTQKLAIVLGAQQYLLFGNGDSYLKPNFSLGLRYVWNK